jgi:hypothetical protein
LAECCNAEHDYAGCLLCCVVRLSVIGLSVVTLSMVMLGLCCFVRLSVIWLNVMAPNLVEKSNKISSKNFGAEL